MAASNNTTLVNNIKSAIFPAIFGFISLSIWTNVREIHDDIKLLMAQSNIDKTKIENFEERISTLEQVVFIYGLKKTASNNIPPIKKDNKFNQPLFIRNNEDDENKF